MQKQIIDYIYVKHIYIPMGKEYSQHRGLSERQIRKRLEQEGWTVWRGGCLNILKRDELYPNVRKKYTRMMQLLESSHSHVIEHLQFLSAVHHGMPDFLCFRMGLFKFVECKFKHEQLSDKQKKCIKIIQSLGLHVEVHKLVDHPTKMRTAQVDLDTGDKIILEEQMALRKF